MAQSIVQSASNNGSGASVSVSVTWPGSTTAGNLLVATCVTVAGSKVGSITAPANWVTCGNNVGRASNSNTFQFYYPNAPSQSSTGNFSTDANGTGLLIVVAEVAASSISPDPLDQATGFADTSIQATSNTGTTSATTQANEIVIAGFCGVSTGSYGTLSSGYAVQQQATAVTLNNCMAFKVISATGTQTCQATDTLTAKHSNVIATFKAAAGGTTFTRTASDKIGFQDARSRTATCLRSRSDNLGMRDSVARLATSKRSRADNIGMRDLTKRLQSALRSRSDNIGLRDAIAYRELFARRVVEALGIQDTTKRNAVLKRLLADNVGFRDIASDREIIGAAQHYLSLLFAAGS